MPDPVFMWVSLAANIAQVVAIGFLIKQIRVGSRQTRLAQSSLKIGTDQMRLAQSALEETRAERTRQLESQRRGVWAALRAEVNAIHTAATIDLERFNPSNLAIPQVKSAYDDRQIEGEGGYHRAFVWTPLPFSTIEQAIHEADLLELTPERIQALQDLRLTLLRANALVVGKTAILPTLLQGQVQRGFQLAYDRWIDMKADNMNRSIIIEFNNAVNSCNRINEWLKSV